MKRVGVVLAVVILLISGALVRAVPPAQAQETVVLISVESARSAVEAWVIAFRGMQPDVTFDLRLAAADEDVMAQAAEADIVIYHGFEQEPPVDFECGTISRAYVLLPDVGARYLASGDCGDSVAPKTVLLKSFLKFMVSPDGQQIAIDLGFLPASVEVTDQGGVTVDVPQPVRNIVSAYGVATYYTYALGAGDRLVAAAYVGVKSPATQDTLRRVDPHFDAMYSAVSVLSQNEINLEEVASLQPGLILSSARTSWLDTASELNIPILRFEGETPEHLKDAMTLIGAVLGPDAAYQAAQFDTYYDDVFARIREQVSTLEGPAPRVYFSGTEPLRTVSSEMYQTAMIEAAGGESVSKDLTGYWNDVNLEQVLVWNPDVIFVPTYGGASVEAITGSDEWSILDAVKAGHVYQLPQFISPWDTPVPDSILGIIWMADTLYPGQLDLGCQVEVANFYNRFYDYPISAEEAASLCD
jgi:iron complex transport system substrate-binding protein